MRNKNNKKAYINNKSNRTIPIIGRITPFNKRIVILICILLAVLALIMLFNVTSSAKNTYHYDTYYSNVYIDNGDTLWNIAKNNYSVEYGDFNNYIEEIRTLNHLTNDNIHAGGYLVIPTIH